MPLLADLPIPKLTISTRVWMEGLRGYLIMAILLVAYHVIQIALGGA
jgi:hypothetical protein